MDKLMQSEGLWHLVEQIFGDLDYQSVVECRKVSKLWHESLEWISLVKFLLDFGDKLAEYHRSIERDPEEKVLAIISGWKKGVQNCERSASIYDLRELKGSFEQSLGKCWNGGWNQQQQHLNHPFQYVVCNVQLLKFLFGTSYRVEAFHLALNFSSQKN